MTEITRYLSMLAVNVNGLHSPIKRHHLTNWIKKEDPTICCLQETHLINRNKHRLRVKSRKNIDQANGLHKQSGVAILLLDKVDFKPTLIKWDKEGHSILITGGGGKRYLDCSTSEIQAFLWLRVIICLLTYTHTHTHSLYTSPVFFSIGFLTLSYTVYLCIFFIVFHSKLSVYKGRYFTCDDAQQTFVGGKDGWIDKQRWIPSFS
jgi:hypothetical protein